MFSLKRIDEGCGSTKYSETLMPAMIENIRIEKVAQIILSSDIEGISVDDQETCSDVPSRFVDSDDARM